MDDKERQQFSEQWIDSFRPNLGRESQHMTHRCTGKSTASILSSFSEATKNPGTWVQILDPSASDNPPGWLISYAKRMAVKLGFVYEWRFGDGKIPSVKFEIADARRQR